MHKLLLIAMIALLSSRSPALVSHADSEDFAMDTIDPLVELLSPQGGEEWFIGESKNILWSATDHNFPAHPISLQYSINGGTLYLDLASDLEDSGTYLWLLPYAQTTSARVKVMARDSFGNSSQAASPQNFSLLIAPPLPPGNVTVDTGNGLDAVISWDPVTLTVPPSSLPITPDGYIVLYNESPYEDEHFFYFLGRSFTTQYTHHDVVEFRDQMFYRVVAYKNYTREAEQDMEHFLQRTEGHKISWDELAAALKGARP